MNTFVLTSGNDQWYHLRPLLQDAATKYARSAYISFDDPFQLVIGLLEFSAIGKEKFVVIDSTQRTGDVRTMNETTYVIPVHDLFNVYMHLRSIIEREGIQFLLLDSLSTLIEKHQELPIKEMCTDLLLEVGRMGCDTSIVVFHRHAEHEVVNHLQSLISRQTVR